MTVSGRVLLSSIIAVWGMSPCWAHELIFTKDSPKLLYVQGEASRSIAVDGVRLHFTFPTEKGSFAEAGTAGQEVVEAIRKSLADIQGPTISLTHGWDLLKQATISRSTKGRRIDHDLVVELEAVPPGKLHELVAQVIDRSLQASDKLELERIEVYLTEAKEQEAQSALFNEAATNASSHAQAIAKATGVQLAGPRHLFATGEAVSHTALQEAAPSYASLAQKQLMASLVIRKSFKVEADVPDHLELSVSVVGVFDVQ